ncbi:MAG: pirin family protein [Acidimicrobiales bacterium]|nr:pirin family protein [Acidimicrobiales bacterium]
MSGPVSTDDTDIDTPHDGARPPCVEVIEGRVTEVGGLPVSRVLPRRARRTVGSWCFADHFGPTDVEVASMSVGPHPHIGLQTVTWIIDGEVLHRDSLGTEQLIRPGQLNLMTAGRGVSHAEETPDDVFGELHGVQLWIAQPDSSRFAEPDFEHHASLPQAELGGGGRATVLMGSFAGATSPARSDTPLVGADLVFESAVAAELDPGFEHAVIVVEGSITIDHDEVMAGALAYLGQGRDELELTTDEHARVILIGGPPLDDDLLMWWNFVARTRDEIDDARQDWQASTERFGHVASSLDRIDAPTPHWHPPRSPHEL